VLVAAPTGPDDAPAPVTTEGCVVGDGVRGAADRVSLTEVAASEAVVEELDAAPAGDLTAGVDPPEHAASADDTTATAATDRER
jgi:hypothetical protein